MSKLIENRAAGVHCRPRGQCVTALTDLGVKVSNVGRASLCQIAMVAEGLAVSAGAKAAVSDYCANRGLWPVNNNEAGLANEQDILGNYTEHVAVENNVIEIQYGYDARAEKFAKKVTVTAVYNAGSIDRTCASGGAIQSKHLPAACR